MCVLVSYLISSYILNVSRMTMTKTTSIIEEASSCDVETSSCVVETIAVLIMCVCLNYVFLCLSYVCLKYMCLKYVGLEFYVGPSLYGHLGSTKKRMCVFQFVVFIINSIAQLLELLV